MSETVRCCYCGESQLVDDPPSLATCVKCKHDFRVLRNRSGINVDLAADAKRFFEPKQESA